MKVTPADPTDPLSFLPRAFWWLGVVGVITLLTTINAAVLWQLDHGGDIVVLVMWNSALVLILSLLAMFVIYVAAASAADQRR